MSGLFIWTNVAGHWHGPLGQHAHNLLQIFVSFYKIAKASKQIIVIKANKTQETPVPMMVPRPPNITLNEMWGIKRQGKARHKSCLQKTPQEWSVVAVVFKRYQQERHCGYYYANEHTVKSSGFTNCQVFWYCLSSILCWNRVLHH